MAVPVIPPPLASLCDAMPCWVAAVLAALAASVITVCWLRARRLARNRVYVPPESVMAVLKDAPLPKEAELAAAIALRRQWVLEAAGARKRVPVWLWVEYRYWVDDVISGKEASVESFHAFAYAHALALPAAAELLAHWSGSDVADLLACLADAGLLGAGDSVKALRHWLEESLRVYNSRFQGASNRRFGALTHANEGEWRGAYDFIQIADPQASARAFPPPGLSVLRRPQPHPHPHTTRAHHPLRRACVCAAGHAPFR